jgi:hypothetical protein
MPDSWQVQARLPAARAGALVWMGEEGGGEGGSRSGGGGGEGGAKACVLGVGRASLDLYRVPFSSAYTYSGAPPTCIGAVDHASVAGGGGEREEGGGAGGSGVGGVEGSSRSPTAFFCPPFYSFFKS